MQRAVLRTISFFIIVAEGGLEADGVKAHVEGCKETLSVAMDILVSNFASSNALNDKDSKSQAGQQVLTWFQTLKDTGKFGPVPNKILQDRRLFESDRISDRISDQQTLETIKSYYKQVGYVLDPHSAVAVTAAKGSIDQTGSHMPYISMSTAHPAKFSEAVKLALKDEHDFEFEKSVLPAELARLVQMEKRVITVENSWETVREIIKKISKEKRNKSNN
ncbi:hypothetical protein B7463_g2315, partial [Scytalidium lignicola]